MFLLLCAQTPRLKMFSFMLDKKDIQILQGMFLENNAILKRDLRLEMHDLITASERRLIARMDRLRTEIVTDVAEVLDECILPQIADLQDDMAMVKRHLKLA